MCILKFLFNTATKIKFIKLHLIVLFITVLPFVGQDLVMVKWLVYLGETQGYVIRRLKLSVYSRLGNRCEKRGQTKSNPNGPLERYKKENMYPV